ncbi:MAG TPA: TIGR03085 family metal-binding protein [Mycobacteriales bacterium]|nr:TIGR03085 family metal-binding protein [Mycobacteriales bacterium]
MTSTADAERAALCDLLTELGPSAPTLCEGWDTRALATHLMVRDRDPKAWAGIAVPKLSDLASRAMDSQADKPYDEIVAAVRAGAPKWSPLGLPGAKDVVNLLEYVIHHEDVRRAQPGWGPRAVPASLADSVWRAVKVGSRATLRRAPDGVVLRRAGTSSSVTAKKGELTVTVVGDPVELALFTSGRQRAARVDLTGDDAAISRLRNANLGF